MASHLSPHPRKPPDEPSWFGGMSPFRTRRRVIFCLFVATFALISVYFHWQQPLHSAKYFKSCQSLDPQTPCVPGPFIDFIASHTVTTTTVQPVVFALIMYSESSAMEGAVLLKVLYMTLLFLDCGLV